MKPFQAKNHPLFQDEIKEHIDADFPVIVLVFITTSYESRETFVGHTQTSIHANYHKALDFIMNDMREVYESEEHMNMLYVMHDTLERFPDSKWTMGTVDIV